MLSSSSSSSSSSCRRSLTADKIAQINLLLPRLFLSSDHRHKVSHRRPPHEPTSKLCLPLSPSPLSRLPPLLRHLPPHVPPYPPPPLPLPPPPPLRHRPCRLLLPRRPPQAMQLKTEAFEGRGDRKTDTRTRGAFLGRKLREKCRSRGKRERRSCREHGCTVNPFRFTV
ncbi:hypothetical protein TIFTF001_006955 [Ficus carica]|uniref:Uncharacterized protein n=1 Tax=Ficus carica TaxID=3494 RepID=A0AA87ZK40_FICCA|nr:hypothetical protein TIFTF001_006955 [Ficus carica]